LKCFLFSTNILNKEDQVSGKKEMVPLDEAKRQVEITSERLALLHLAFARTIVDELGDEKGKQLVLRAIKDYARRVGDGARRAVVAQGLEPVPENYGKAADLPLYGMHEAKERVDIGGENRVRAHGCVMGKVWIEQGEAELGRLYCFVDAAKYMYYNPDYKMVHTKALPDGDEYCELCVRPTTNREKEDFASDSADWTYIDG
jgi:hypothetical protein